MMKRALFSVVLAAMFLLGAAFTYAPAHTATPYQPTPATGPVITLPVTTSQLQMPATAKSAPATPAATNLAHTANTPTVFPYPVQRLGVVIYVECPIALLSQDPQTSEWQEADYIEPEFEVMPENVLWVVEQGREYRLQVDYGSRTQNIDLEHLPKDTTYDFHIIYTGDVKEGGLGEFRVEFSEYVDGVFVVCRGVLKFVADDGANLFCTPDATMDQTGKLTVNFRPRQEGETYNHQFKTTTSFAQDVLVCVIQNLNQATVYDTDLSQYLYPYGVPEELEEYFADQPTLNPDLKPQTIAVGSSRRSD